MTGLGWNQSTQHHGGRAHIPAGWYPDPSGAPGQRWWDGNDWGPERHRLATPKANTSQTESSPPAGWYPDPSASAGQRWWDGNDWSSQTPPSGKAESNKNASQTPPRRMRRTFAAMSWPKRTIVSVVAAAGAIGTIAGAVNVIVPVEHWVSHHFQQQKPGLLNRSQELGFEIWQNKQRVDMYQDSSTPMSSYEAQRANVDAAAFELRFPAAHAQPGIRIVAWTDRSVFQIEQGKPAQTVGTNHWFGVGRGMADTNASSANLMISNNGFMYFIGTRADPISPEQVAIYFNSVTKVDESGRPVRPLSTLKGKELYFVMWVDTNADKIVDNGEYEYLTVHF